MVSSSIMLTSLSIAMHAQSKSELGVDSAEFKTWYDNHKDDCAINYVGSSNAMEMKAACRLWSHSEVLGLRYTGFLNDF